jgi:hypothetical protein
VKWVQRLEFCGFWFYRFQIQKLKNDIAAQNNKKATMEARASDAEKKVQELNAKLERVSAQPWLSSLLVHNFYCSCGYQLLERFHLLSAL